MPEDAELFLGVKTLQTANSGSSTTQATDLDDLQRVANYRLIRKSLRPNGIGSIIFGLIAIGLGTSQMGANPVNGILALIGVFLTIEGIWLVSSPVPVGIIVDGFALIILGIWNICITCMNASSGSDGPGAFGFIGVWQIVMGFQSFGRLGRFSKMPQSKPTAEEMQRIVEMVAGIKSATMTNDSAIIEFTQKASNRQQAWKGRLDMDKAFFAGPGGSDLIFAQKREVVFKNNGKVLIGKALKATFSIGDRTLSGTITPSAFQRYENWKNMDPAVAQEAPMSSGKGDTDRIVNISGDLNTMPIYLYQNETQQGPFTGQQIRDMVISGAIQQNEFAWCEGLSTWKPLNEVISFNTFNPAA